MDKQKIKAMLEWVNALNVCETPVTALKDFQDGNNFLRVLEAVCKEDRQSETDTALGRFCVVEEFLQGFYQASETLNKNVDFESAAHGNEIEIAKVLVLLLAAAVQHQDREHFVETAMSLSLGLQAEVKELLEPLLMTEGQTIPIIPEDLLSILMMKRKSPPSPTRPQRSVVRALMQSPGVAGCFTNSPLTPIKALIQSPQMAYKLRIRETEKKNKNLEKDLTEERHLKSELEWVLEQKKGEIQNQEKKIRDLEKRTQEHKHFLDQLDEMGMLKEDKEKMEAECSRLRSKLQDYQNGKQILLRLEAENKELYQTIHDLKNQLKSRDSVKEESASLKAHNRYLEDKTVEQDLEASQLTEVNNKMAALLQTERAELEKVREIHREKMKDMREQFEQKAVNSPIGETMAVVTQKRVFELEAEISELKASLIEPDVHQRLEDNLKKVNETRQNAEGALVDCKRQILGLEAQLSTHKSKCIDYQEQVESLTTSKQTSNERADAQESLVLLLRDQDAKHLQTQKSLEVEKSRLKEACESLKTDLSIVSDSLELVTKERDGGQSTCESLRDELKKTLEDGQEKRKSLERVHQAEENKLNAKVKQLQSEIFSSQEEKYTVEQDLSDKLNTESQVSQKMEQKLQELVKECKDICCQKSKLLNEMEELREEKSKEEVANICLGKELAGAKSELVSVNGAFEKLQDSLQELNIAKANSEKKLETVSGELELERKYMTELRDRVSSLQDAAGESEKEKNNLVVRIEQMTVDMANSRTEKVELELELRQAQDTEARLKDRLNTRKEGMKNREEEFKNDLMSYETAISQLKSSFEKEILNMKKCHDDLYEERRCEVEAYKSEMAQVSNELVVAEKRNTLLDEKWTEARNMVDKLETEVENQQIEFSKLTESKDKEIVSLEDKLTEMETVTSNHVSNLEQRLKNLERDSAKTTADFEEKLTIAASKMQHLKEQHSAAIAEAESEVKLKESCLETEKARSAQLEGEVDNFKTQLMQISHQTDDLKQIMTASEATLAEIRCELENKKQRIAAQEAELNKERNCYTNLENELSNFKNDMTEQVYAKEIEVGNEKMKCLRLTEEMEAMQTELDDVQAVMMSQEQAHKDTIETLQMVEQKLTEVNSEVTEKEAEIVASEQNVAMLKQNLQKLEEELASTQELVFAKDGELAYAEDCYKELEVSSEEKVIQLQQSLQAVESGADESTKRVLELQQTRLDLEETFAEVRKQMAIDAKKAESSKADLEKRVCLLQSVIEEKEGTVNEMVEARHILEVQMAFTVEEVKKEADDMVADLEKNVKEMQNDLEVKVTEQTHVVAQLEHTEEQVKILRREITELETKSEEKISELVQEVEQKDERLQELISREEELIVACDTEKKVVVDLETKLVQLEEEISEEKARHTVMIQEQNEAKMQEIEQLVVKNDQLKQVVSEKDTEVEALIAAKQELECAVIEKDTKVEGLTAANVELENTIAEKVNEVQVLSAAKQELESTVLEKNNQLEVLNEAKIELETVIAEKSNEVQVLSAVKHELELTVVEKDNQVKVLNEAKTEFESVIAEKCNEIEVLSAAKQELESIVVVKDSQVEDLIEAKTEFESVIAEKCNEIEVLSAAKQELESIVVVKDSQVEDLIEAKTEFESVIAEKCNEVEVLSAAKQELELTVVEKDNQVKVLNEAKTEFESVIAEKCNEVEILSAAKQELELTVVEKDNQVKVLNEAKTEFESVIAEKCNEVEVLSAAKQELESTVLEKDNQVEDLNEAKTEFESVIAEKCNEVEVLSAAKQDLELTVVEKDNQVKVLNEAKTEFESVIAEKCNEVEVLSAAKQELECAVLEKSNQVEALSEAKVNLEHAIAEKVNEFEVLSAGKQELECVVLERESEVEGLSAAKVELENAITEKDKKFEVLCVAKQELENALLEKDSIVAILSESKIELENAIAGKNHQLEILSVAKEGEVGDLKTALQSIINAKDEEVKAKSAEVKDLGEQVLNLDSDLKEKAQNVEQLNTETASAKLEIDTLEQTMTDVKLRLADTETREAEVKNHLEKQLQVLSEKENEITALNSQIETVKSELAASETQRKQDVAEAEKKVAELESVVRERQTLAEEKEELLREEAESKTQLQTRVLQLQFDHQCSQKQYAETQQACSKGKAREENFSEEITNNKRKLETMKLDIQEYELKVEQLSKMNSILKDTKTSLTTDLGKSRERIKQVEDQYREKIEMIEESVKEQMASERELFQERICELEAELKEKVDEYQDNENQLMTRNHEKDKLSLEIQSLQKKLTSADVKYETLDKKFKTQVEREQKLILNKTREIRLAEDLNKSLRAQLEKEQEKNNTDMDDVMKQLECISKEKQTLTDENTELTTALRRDKQSISEFEKKTEKLNEYISKLKSERKKLIEEQEKSHGLYDKEIHRLQEELESESDLKEKFLHRYQKEETETKALRSHLSSVQGNNLGLSVKSPSRSVLSPNRTFKSPEISAIKSSGRSPRHFDDSLDFMDDSLEFEELTTDQHALELMSDHDKENRHDNLSMSMSLRSSMTSIASSHNNYFSPRSGRHRSPSLKSLGANTTLGQSLPCGMAMGSLFSCEDEPDPGFETEWDRLSELKRRNTLCLPHMRSSYPVETQARDPDQMAKDLMKSLPVPTQSNSNTKYEQSTRRRMSPSELSDDLMKTHESADSHPGRASIYNSCHRTLPSSFKVPHSVPLKAEHKMSKSCDKHSEKESSSIFTAVKASITPQKKPKESRRTPHKKHHKTPSSSKKHKGVKQALIDENTEQHDDLRESFAFSIPITPNKKKSKGLMKKFTSDKKEPESPKVRKPLHARNFLLFGQ